MLEHANLTVTSIDEAKRFLTTAFPDFDVRGGGFLHGDESLGDWVHLGNDDTYLALQQNRTPAGDGGQTYITAGVNHLGFVVEDVDSIMARLDAAGYAPSDASSLAGHPHRRRVYYVDGNGFEWEFVEYLSAAPAERNFYESAG